MRLAYIFVIIAFLSGCAISRSNHVEDQLHEMKGLSKEQVLSCMGPPVTKSNEGSTDVWTYTLSGAHNISANSNNATISQEACRINLTFKSDKVTSVNFLAQGGHLLTPNLPCAGMFDACVP